MKRFGVYISILSMICHVGHTQVLSDFEQGHTDGWVSEGDGDYLWEGGTGNPGGCFRVNDDATGNMNRAYAPLKFLGDWSAATPVDTLRADIFLHKIASAYVGSNFVFRIIGPGGQATGILNPTPPNDTWITYSLPLEESAWQLNDGTWSGLMQQVTTLIVTMEYINGDEYVRLDNVGLSITPMNLPVIPVICSDFEAGGFDGWTFTGAGGVSNQSSGGNPGRYIQVANGSGTAYAFAPPKFLGDWTQLDNHAADVRFDLKITGTSGSLVLSDAFLSISGPGGEAKIAADTNSLRAVGGWYTFNYPVEESAWNVVSGTWPTLIDQVEEVAICLEFFSGSETVGFDNFCISDLPPIADFTVDRTRIFAGEPVQFQDHSTQGPASWDWDFGDGQTSTLYNPVHNYDTPGLYTASLTVANHFGSSTETRQDLIEVLPVDECLKFTDDFNDNSIDPLWQTINGSWSETGGIMRQTSNYYINGNLLGACYALAGTPLWTDYAVSCKMQSTDNDRIGLVFNYQDPLNMYMFIWHLQTPQRLLYKWVNGTGTILASDNVGYATNTWYDVEVIYRAGKIILNIDGSEIFNILDNTYSGGKAGLYCYGNSNSYWDDVVIECSGYEMDLKVMLEGPFEGPAMSTNLNGLPDFPLMQPYSVPPWDYSGTESVTMVPSTDIVDWILLEYRDAPDASQANVSTRIARQAAFLMNDGSVTGMDAVRLPVLREYLQDNLYMVIWHRNHLAVMSAQPLNFAPGMYSYDFTTGAGQIYGGNLGGKELEPGVWGMAGGDGNADDIVSNPDKIEVWVPQAGSSGYLTGDFNLDGNVSNIDKIDIWAVNGGRGSQVP
ncbi:MAG: PKD domain-containing protein [Bacteroidales bacterium]|nr:PKD domain-containing protein [Bacteroidales bacterium]